MPTYLISSNMNLMILVTYFIRHIKLCYEHWIYTFSDCNYKADEKVTLC